MSYMCTKSGDVGRDEKDTGFDGIRLRDGVHNGMSSDATNGANVLMTR